MSAGEGVRDLPRQPHRRSAHWIQAPFRLGHTELRAFAGDANVCALQDLGAARDRGSFHRGDQRLGQAAALEQRVDPRRVVAAVLERVARRLGRRRLQVHARAEVAAGARQDAGPDVGIAVHAVPRLDHYREHLGGQRVARLGPVQRQQQSVSALLNDGVGAVVGFTHRCIHLPTDLNKNVTRSNLGSVALNIADLPSTPSTPCLTALP